MVPAPYRLASRRRETADTWTLRLEPLSGVAPDCAPGQFTMLYAFGVGEVPISVSGGPSRAGALVHTVRAAGSVTRAITALRRGEVVGVRGPFGAGWPLAEAEGADVVVVAGGLGLAPLRPAVLALLRRRRRYGRVTVLYGGRGPEDLLYRAELARWAARPDLALAVCVDHARPGWPGPVGFVTSLIPSIRIDPGSTVAIVCGPEVMMRLASRALLDSGIPARRVAVSLERNMRCAVGLCGHCQLGTELLCRDGPVLGLDRAAPLLEVREL
jgi:NAD(P)H-flavin reductase